MRPASEIQPDPPQASPGGNERASRRAVAVAYFVTSLLVLLPVLLVTYPRMVDYPNHLARYHILHSMSPNSALVRFYETGWHLGANLAVDVAIVPLMAVFPPLVAGRLITGLSMLLWLLAPATLHRVLWGRWSVWPLAASLFVYNANLTHGFTNYYLTFPLAMLLFAGWLAARQRGWAPLATAAMLVVGSLVVYCGHPVAFVALGLLVGGHAFGELVGPDIEGRRWPRFLAAVLPFTLGIGLLAFDLPYGSLPQSANTYVFGDLEQKVTALIAAVDGMHGAFDLGLMLAVAVAGVVIYPHCALHRGLRVPLLAVAAATVAAPFSLLGVEHSDVRLPAALAVVIVASVRPVAWRGWPWAAAALAALLVVRMVVLTQDWVAHDRDVTELMNGLGKVKRGSRLLPAQIKALSPMMRHAPAYAVVKRNVFLPTLFTGGPTLQTTERFRPLDTPSGHPVRIASLNRDEVAVSHHYWKDWRKHYDYMVVLRNPDQKPESPPRGLEVIARGRLFTLYRIPNKRWPQP